MACKRSAVRSRLAPPNSSPQVLDCHRGSKQEPRATLPSHTAHKNDQRGGLLVRLADLDAVAAVVLGNIKTLVGAFDDAFCRFIVVDLGDAE